MKKVQILGIRGLPPSHGGFESFVAKLAPYLVHNNFEVTVFCQTKFLGLEKIDEWLGVRLIHVVAPETPVGSILFDLKSLLISRKMEGSKIVFGYNTALLSRILLRKSEYLINMDGLEWKRSKWSKLVKMWFWFNELLAIKSPAMLIADHPIIAERLRSRKAANFTMIPYGADIPTHRVDPYDIEPFRLEKDSYGLIIARPEPENSILEMVRAFSRKNRNIKLVLLGEYNTQNKYCRQVMQAASNEVIFLGPIYDSETVLSLRMNAKFFMCGHTAGGTNPTLVESLAIGSVNLCLNSPFLKWVAGEGSMYFENEEDCSHKIDKILHLSISEVEVLKSKSLSRFREEFLWEKILPKYLHILQSNGKN